MDHDAGIVARHERNFTELEADVRELQGQMSLVQIRQNRVYTELFNGDDGVTGLVPELRRLISEANGARQEQGKQHQQNSTKLNVILAVCAMATLVLMAVGIFVTYEVGHHARLDPAHIFHSHSSEPVLSFWQRSQQDAGSVTAVHY